MEKKELIIAVAIIAFVMTGLIYYYTNIYGNSSSKQEYAETAQIKKDKNNEEQLPAACFNGTVDAVKTWDMPKELTEISGISWIDGDKVATIEDNNGIIYIYSLKNEKVEKQIKFGESGDYEGIAYVKPNYFVMRADGFMYEINADGKVLNEYDLPLTAKDDVEPFYFDAANNRFLIGQKEGRKGTDRKEIYSFDLASRTFNTNPVFTIDLNHPVFTCEAKKDKTSDKEGKKDKGKQKDDDKKKNSNEFKPSEIVIHPQTKDIYIADGPNQRVLVLSPDAKPQYFLKLDDKIFPQAEGMMFSPDGEFYVSSEGVKGSGNICKTSISVN